MSWRVASAFGRMARKRFGRSNERTKTRGAADEQLLGDFVPCRLVRGRRHRDHLDALQRFRDLAQAQIFRAEIVAPLRDAMRFVDGETDRP